MTGRLADPGFRRHPACPGPPPVSPVGGVEAALTSGLERKRRLVSPRDRSGLNASARLSRTSGRAEGLEPGRDPGVLSAADFPWMADQVHRPSGSPGA